MDNLMDKNILVVGASSGIGYELASLLIKEGANVFSASRSKPEHLQVTHFPLDVTNMTGEELKDLPDTLHGLVYCPGTINLKPFQRLNRENFQHDLNVNLLGAVGVVQACLRNLKKADTSSIVFFSTVAAQVGMGFHASIAAAKGAVEGLAKSLAAELAPQKVRANVIAPSLTDTPLAGNLLSTDEKKEASGKRHPLGRFGTTEDMASVAKFLLSDGSSWMTGQVLGVDGGISGTRSL